VFRNQQQLQHCGLPFLGIVFGLGQFRDLERRIAQRHQRLPAGQIGSKSR
jgi:hypothetical protein